MSAGVSWFFWFTYEDRGLVAVMLVASAFAAGIGLTALARWLGDRVLSQSAWLVGASLAGLAGGASVGVVAVLLMLVKVSLHDHPVPDFTQADLGAVLGRTPVWAISGALVGGALGLLLRGDQEETGG